MKRLFCLLICVVFLMTGCAGTAADQTVAPRTPDSLAMAFAMKLTDNGFFVQPEEGTKRVNTHTYGVFSSTLGIWTRIWLVIKDEEDSITEVRLEMYHPENLPSDIDAFTDLMQWMVQVCDTTYAQSDKRAQDLVRSTFELGQTTELQQVHGLTYDTFGENLQSLNFRVYYPGSDFAANETAEALQGQKAFDFSAQALLDELGSRLEQEQFSLERIEMGTAGIAELAMRPTDGSPEVYAIVHALGITVGWLMLYTTEAGLVQIDLVDRDNGDRLRYLVMRELREQLVLSCDPVLRQDNSDEIDKKIDEIAYYIRLNTPIVENGIQYIKSSDGASYPLTMTVAD